MTDTRQVLEEAWERITIRPPSYAFACSDDSNSDETLRQLGKQVWDWAERKARFRRFLDAEAWTDAALMLVGPDRWLEFKGPRKYLNIPTPVPAAWSAHIAQWNHEGDVVGWGDTLAEAIAAACIKAKEQAALRAQEAGDV